MRKLLPFFLSLVFFSLLAGGCKKDEVDAEEQHRRDVQLIKDNLVRDEQLIKDYLVTNNITAERHSSGIHYVIVNAGSGSSPVSSSRVTVKYVLRLLDGAVIPQTTEPVSFFLADVISGWRIGVPLIKQGGKIRLFIPSGYAYGPTPRTGIPANSVLDFDIELLEVTN
jgi:FKBP-type peptidyl-prolyl cis-trans isomerase FkpA